MTLYYSSKSSETVFFIVILDTGHHLMSHPTDISIYNNVNVCFFIDKYSFHFGMALDLSKPQLSCKTIAFRS